MTFPPDCNKGIHFQIPVLLLRLTAANQEFAIKITTTNQTKPKKLTEHSCANRKENVCQALFQEDYARKLGSDLKG